MSLFKIINTEPETKAKLKDTDFRSFYPTANLNMAYSTLKPFIEQAEESYIIPYISRAFYTEIEAEYQSDATLATEKSLAVRHIRTALAYYTAYYAMPHINIRIADAGIQETAADSASPTRQWVYNNARWEAQIRAYEYLDKALNYMEAQIVASNTDFDTYKASVAYIDTKEVFLNSAEVFNTFFYIKSSRKAYHALRPYIKKAESLYLNPLLGESFVIELKNCLCWIDYDCAAI